jgi:lia operon protein LiaF
MRWFFGLLLILIGITILGNNVGWFDFNLGDFIHHFWPVILIVVGLSIIFERHRDKPWHSGEWTAFSCKNFSKTMGDVHLKPSGIDPSGLRAEQGLGDINIDLTNTTLSTGENRVECSLGVGDIRIILPNNVPVFASCTAGVGDVHILDKHADGFGPKLNHQDADYVNADKKIRLIGKVGLGDIKVTHG